MLDTFPYHVADIQPLSRHVAKILLIPKRLPVLIYAAGQYVHVLQSNDQVSPLSIANAPREDGQLEFHLFHPATNTKAQELLQVATHEKTWRIQGPYGTCTANRLAMDRPIIFIAYGTGLAPIKAIIESLVGKAILPKITLFWKMPAPEVFYLENFLGRCAGELQNFSSVLLPTEADVSAAVLQDYPDLTDFQIYTTGSREFVHGVFNEFSRCGLKRDLFFSDLM